MFFLLRKDHLTDQSSLSDHALACHQSFQTDFAPTWFNTVITRRLFSCSPLQGYNLNLLCFDFTDQLPLNVHIQAIKQRERRSLQQPSRKLIQDKIWFASLNTVKSRLYTVWEDLVWGLGWAYKRRRVTSFRGELISGIYIYKKTFRNELLSMTLTCSSIQKRFPFTCLKQH